jgi:hypothetical protein
MSQIHEQEMLQVIDQRDKAEESLSQALDRIESLEATVETLKGLLRMYRKNQWHKKCTVQPTNKLFPDRRCGLCKRTDQQLQPKQELK